MLIFSNREKALILRMKRAGLKPDVLIKMPSDGGDKSEVVSSRFKSFISRLQ